MEDKKEVTVMDVLEDSTNALTNISIPVPLVGSIGQPLYRVLENLNAAISAIKKNQANTEPEESK